MLFSGIGFIAAIAGWSNSSRLAGWFTACPAYCSADVDVISIEEVTRKLYETSQSNVVDRQRILRDKEIAAYFILVQRFN